jgi:hypothetical protein
VRPGSLRVAAFVTGPDDNGDFLDTSRERLFDQDAEYRFLGAIAVDEGLKRQRTLRPRGSGDDSLPN